jgi:lipopolysaccharide/colanic/teichoic acid biosynthesis glycosyltransferase
VNGRNALSWSDKFKRDVEYVEQQSFVLDCKILFLTLKKVLVSEGISQNGEATTKYFKGNDFN